MNDITTSSVKSASSRVVWITGASSGIGASLAGVFAENGDVVVATARNARALETLRREIVTKGGQCEILRCDVKKEFQVERVARSILRKHGGIDILVNNAGITSFKYFSSTAVREFDNVITTNLRGLFLTTKRVLPSMMKRRRGMIINILSFAAKTVYTKSAAYSASKSGAEAMMNVLRSEVRESGIKVVNVYPGAVLTSMWGKRHRQKYARRMIDAESVARLVYEASTQDASVLVEELIIRPQGGDLRV
ncbi:MAG: SDR family oxidoreductase [Ignavibacteriales bacterium]|nr:SDR family oxidoreductase [Ignavibacteriales bacterium]